MCVIWAEVPVAGWRTCLRCSPCWTPTNAPSPWRRRLGRCRGSPPSTWDSASAIRRVRTRKFHSIWGWNTVCAHWAGDVMGRYGYVVFANGKGSWMEGRVEDATQRNCFGWNREPVIWRRHRWLGILVRHTDCLSADGCDTQLSS